MRTLRTLEGKGVLAYDRRKHEKERGMILQIAYSFIRTSDKAAVKRKYVPSNDNKNNPIK